MLFRSGSWPCPGSDMPFPVGGRAGLRHGGNTRRRMPDPAFRSVFSVVVPAQGLGSMESPIQGCRRSGSSGPSLLQDGGKETLKSYFFYRFVGKLHEKKTLTTSKWHHNVPSRAVVLCMVGHAVPCPGVGPALAWICRFPGWACMLPIGGGTRCGHPTRCLLRLLLCGSLHRE